MTRFYLDTSAAGELLVEEAESSVLAAWADQDDVEVVATDLLETELRRLAQRLAIPQPNVTELLDRVDLYEVAPSMFREAGVLPGRTLRSLDALHLVGAIRLGVRAIVTYDLRLAAAAGEVGVAVLAPT